ncbi:MAG: cell envelope-related transcriptional attenuator [Erysipelotrichaceae bacterium]|nr:MAG: cell envelope-related transcriptional attenuator [Erysipelotrichaceae bacterium]
MSKNKRSSRISRIVFFVSATLLIAGLFYNQILPDMISNIIKVILVLLIIAVILIKVRKLILITLSVFMFIASGTLFYSQYSINRLISQENTEIDVITLVVLKNSPLTSIDDLKDKKIGFAQQMDTGLVKYIKTTITDEVGPYSTVSYEDDLINLAKLYDKTTDVMVLDNSLRETIIELNPDFELKTRIIATIKKVTIKDDTSIPIDTSKDPFVILISGVDSRTAGAVMDKARSDVNILMIIHPKEHKILTISIPRDTYTPLACRNGAMDKLTHSGIFGIDCTVETIEDIVKVLGTIEVYSQYAFKVIYYEKNITYSFIKGMNKMNAEKALVFARERHALPNGDFQRGINQQEIIKGIINKVIEPQTLLKVESLIKVASKSVVTNMPIESVMNLIQEQISNNTPWTITTSALVGKDDYQPTYSMGKNRLLYVLWPDQTALTDLKLKIDAFMNPTD